MKSRINIDQLERLQTGKQSNETIPKRSDAAPAMPSYDYSTIEKLALFLPCLKQRLFPRRNLFAGPYAGEFGYELMQWQGFVRERKHHYDQVHVLTYPGREYFYEECHVHHHNIDLKQAGYSYGRLSPSDARKMATAKAAEIGLADYDIFDPSLLCTRYHKLLLWHQDFRLLQEPPLTSKTYDVVFHFRAVRKDGPDSSKNYPPQLADELAARCIEKGLAVACVGHPTYSYCPQNAVDHRSEELRETVAAICSARLGVGEASGGMHLINACGKPSLIWGEGEWRIDPAFRWNPFRVSIFVLTTETWQPTPESVCDATLDALAKLRRATSDFSRPTYELPAQRIAPF